jgi:hypothetical protein
MLTCLYHIAVGAGSLMAAVAGIMAVGWLAMTFYDHGTDIDQVRKQLNAAWSEIRDLKRKLESHTQ